MRLAPEIAGWIAIGLAVVTLTVPVAAAAQTHPSGRAVSQGSTNSPPARDPFVLVEGILGMGLGGGIVWGVLSFLNIPYLPFEAGLLALVVGVVGVWLLLKSFGLVSGSGYWDGMVASVFRLFRRSSSGAGVSRGAATGSTTASSGAAPAPSGSGGGVGVTR